MRYTKTALLIFGAGLLLALAVIAAELDRFERAASAVSHLALPIVETEKLLPGSKTSPA